ncbi:unnamed protein product, partial [Choristocarpus tenellus]
GYWRTDKDSEDIRACPIPALCQGGQGGGDTLCFRGNKGYYCTGCVYGYIASTSGVCSKCDTTSVIKDGTVKFLFVTTVAILVIMRTAM